jgi:2-keto-4-pentenoate hydratase/2-oxohepta-3-ene-1,7-dioic acid hydratase in catechol pathway
MKLANIVWRGEPRVAVEWHGDLRVLPERLGDRPATGLDAVIRDHGEPAAWARWAAAVEAGAPAWPVAEPGTFGWRPVVEHPSKILCIGRNYRAHAEETGDAVPTVPIVFDKLPESLAAADEPVPLPAVAREVDYEAELVVVMGRRARRVSEADALDYVVGYAAGNDVSARDLQFQTGQWLIGKALAKFAPVGPYLVTADEVGDPQALRIRLRRNGQVVQDSHTGLMIFSCAVLIHHLSQLWTLNPGDLIFTGTPEGVILGQPAETRQWLQPGERTAVEIDKLGTLENTFVAES